MALWSLRSTDMTGAEANERVVDCDIVDGIATITLDSQHNRNALSRQLLADLHRSLDDAEATGVRAIVLTHRGPAFCAGADLKERASGGSAPADSSPFVRALERLMDAACPTIAVVNGAVRAGGIGLMASCDLVVVHDSTTFALTEVRIGVAPAIIAVPILRRVAPSRIAAAMLTGEAFTAETAREIGLVTHVSSDVVSTVDDLCDGILRGAPAAVAATKRVLHTVPTMERDAAFAAMGALSNELFNGPDAAEGMAAFAEKRLPNWSRAVQ
jgi:enoyl-CoA hydratase/carnithine racemase